MTILGGNVELVRSEGWDLTEITVQSTLASSHVGSGTISSS